MIKNFIEFITESKQQTIIVYHGSNNKFETFNDKHKGSRMGNSPSNMGGFFFTDNIEVAKSFGKYVYTVKLILNNPLIIDAKKKDYSKFKHKLNDIVDTTDKNIYDGILIKNYRDSFHSEPMISTQYIVFNNKKIKILNIKLS